MTTPAERLKNARLAAGLSLDTVIFRAKVALGETYGPSRDTLRRYEDGLKAEEDWDPVVVLTLADIYDTKVADISQLTKERLERVSDLLQRRCAWTDTCAGRSN